MLPVTIAEVDTACIKEKHKKTISQQIDSNLAGKSVLIIEDEEANYSFLKEVLTLNNIKVFWAESGMTGLEMLESGKQFDLILLDIKIVITSYSIHYTKLYDAFHQLRHLAVEEREQQRADVRSVRNNFV